MDVTGDARRFENTAEIQDFWTTQAIRKILADYNEKVFITDYDLLKFGRTENADAATETTVMYLAGTERHETYVTDNSIDTVSSSSAADNQKITLIGHTISGGDLTEVPQTATLNGQSKVPLTTPLHRINRVYNDTTTLDDEFAGSIYVYEDGAITAGVPDTDEDIHMILLAGEQQSEKAATATASNEYLILSKLILSVNRASANASNVDFQLQIRRPNNVFRPIIPTITLRTASQSSLCLELGPYVIVPSNSDVRIVATASANDTVATAGFLGAHARVYT